MKPNESNDPRFGILKTGTTVSDSPSWLDSLLSQIRELREERRNPRPQVEITAVRDFSALEKLIEMPSPMLSLFSDAREGIHDLLHPRKIESSVQPVEVEEIWSKSGLSPSHWFLGPRRCRHCQKSTKQRSLSTLR